MLRKRPNDYEITRPEVTTLEGSRPKRYPSPLDIPVITREVQSRVKSRVFRPDSAHGLRDLLGGRLGNLLQMRNNRPRELLPATGRQR